MSRKVTFKPNEIIEKCPKCGNNTRFTINSQQVQEDCCEIWAICKCGFDPTSHENLGSGNRVESVMGRCDDDNCRDAVQYAWNDTIHELLTKGATK